MEQENSDRLKPWKDQIAVMYLVREELRRVDKNGLWEYHYPELRASEEQLVAAEAYLGHSIDKQYRDFLMCANGWKCFSQSVSLFGTGDLMGSSLMDCAMETLEIMDDAFPFERDTGFSREEFLPIAATFEDKDIHVITRPTSRQPGVVIWFAGEEIERYPNFEEYFLAMADYNRSDIDYFKKEEPPKPPV
jgi:hypothetical protein